MKSKIPLILFTNLLLLLPLKYSQAQINNVENNIVAGTAEFLTERANENFFYIFEKKLGKNEFLKFYFPNTFRLLGTTQLQILLTNKDIWNFSVKNDLTQITENFFKIINEKSKALPADELAFIDSLLTWIQGVEIKIGDNIYPLNAQPISLNSNERIQYNFVFNKFEKFISTAGRIRNISFDDLKSFVQNRDQVIIQIDSIVTSMKEIITIISSSEYTLLNTDRFNSSVLRQTNLFIDIKELINLVKIVSDTSYTNTYRVINSFEIIEYIAEKLLGDAFNSTEVNKNYKEFFENFKTYALFFSRLSEVQSKDEVKSILKSVTMPAVSFGTKRDNSNHIFISSYWGLSVGIESANRRLDFKKQNSLGYAGLTAPIGIEHSWGMGERGSLSLFASVIDFGPVVNSQLFDSGSSIKLKDLISPGIYLVYGFTDIPLAISCGYFHSKAARNNSSAQHHISLNIVFDMPLMVLY